MLKLKSLEFEKIGRFLEKQTINFSSLGNLIQVDALNNNTGGSSGSGKSTIFNSLDYLLGINDLPVSVLQSRGIEEGGIFVSANFDWDGLDITITRSKAKGLHIELPDGTISGSNRLAEEKLDEIIGMPRHLFRKILHKRQNESGFFLQFTPRQVHDFLTDCLGLSEYKIKLDKIDNKIKELELEKENFNKESIGIKSGLMATQDAVSIVGNIPNVDITREMVVKLKEKLDHSIASLSCIELSQSLELEGLELQRPIVSVSPFNHTLLEQYEKERNEIVNVGNAFEQEEKNRQNQVQVDISKLKHLKDNLQREIVSGDMAHKQAIEKAIDIKKIRNNVCPTCDQSWTMESARSKEVELLQEFEELKSIIKIGQDSKQELISIEVSLNDFKNELQTKNNPDLIHLNDKFYNINQLLTDEKSKRDSHNNNENLKNKEILQEFADRQRYLRERHTVDINKFRGQVSLDSMAFESSIYKLKSFEQAKKKYDDNLQALNSKLSILSIKNEELDSKIVHIEEKLQLTEEAKRAVKSFINHCFDDALENIGETATDIIRHIPNMANATIALEALKETKEGKIKEEVNAVLSVDGELDIPIKSLSGGERSAVDLAIDLAVIDLIESKTGKGINLLALDEPFNGLGIVEIEMALEILKNSNSNKKILLVEHNPIVKEMVCDRVIVTRDGPISKIERE